MHGNVEAQSRTPTTRRPRIMHAFDMLAHPPNCSHTPCSPSSRSPLQADSPAVAHLPAGVRSRAYALLTIGPERPRIVTLDPVTETLVGGSLYGNANLLTSKELCITASNIREGAFLRLEQCNPGKPSFQQMFSLTRVQTPEMAAKKLAREAKQAAKGALGLRGQDVVGGLGWGLGVGVRQGLQGL